MRLFPRYLKLTLAQADGEQIDLARLACKFEVSRDGISAYARASVRVYNLSPETVAKVGKKFVRMRLDAGHADRFGMIFEGQITSTYTTRDGADRITDIYGYSGARAIRDATVELKFQAGTSLRTVVRSVAETFTAVPDGPTIEELDVPDVAIVGPRTMAGPTWIYMDQIAKDYDLRWMIDNDKVRVFGVVFPTGGPAITVSRDTGLIGSPIATFQGLEFTSLLDPRLQPGKMVEVVTLGPIVAADPSQLQFANPLIQGLKKGRFNLLRLSHIGESRGQAWYTQAFCYPEVQSNG